MFNDKKYGVNKITSLILEWRNENMISIFQIFVVQFQNGDECHCGTDYDIYGKAINCHRKCRSGEICGGDMANSVYKVGKFHISLLLLYTFYKN